MMENQPRKQIPLDEFREVITGSYASVREQFQQRFDAGIENFVLLTYKAYRQIQSMSKRVPYTERSAWTYEFLYVALNNLVSAFHLQISGFIAPAGNLMRQYAEALAMALLCSHEEIDVYDRVSKERTRFPAHKAIQLVKKKHNRKLLGVSLEGWEDLEEITTFYDDLSHAGVFGASAIRLFGVEGAKSLGGAFDPGKVDFYEREMRLAHTAAMRLLDAIPNCEANLNSGETDAMDRNAT